MNVEAKYSREWLSRAGIILLLLLGSAGWFFYDGFVTYPRYNVGAAAYAELEKMVAEEGLSGDEADAEAARRWEKCAERFNGDPKEPPRRPKNVAQQMHFGIGLAVLAVAYLLWIRREMKRVVRADDTEFDAFTTAFPPFNAMTRVRFDSVFGIDKRKWENKGIAVVHYKDAHGTSRRAVIDDYKYAGSEEILKQCETVIAAKKAAKFAGTTDANSAAHD